MSHPDLEAALAASTQPERAHRWPCGRCGYRGRRASVVCPRCEALPWDGSGGEPSPSGGGAEPSSAPPIAGRILKPGVKVQMRGDGIFLTRHRFTTPEGFLGVLTRRFSGGAHWLGVDGREWGIDRVGILARSWLLRDGEVPVAAAESRGFWQGAYRIFQGNRSFGLVRTGTVRRSFLLAVEDGPEVVRIEGGIVDPLRRITVLAEVPLASVVLSAFVSCGMRQGEAA